MKRTLSLIGLLILGFLLLFNPDTSLVAGVAASTLTPETRPATATGEPPPGDATATTTTGLTGVVPATPPPSDPADGTSAEYSVLGKGVPSEFGVFQAEIVIRNDEIVDIITVSEPRDGRSRRINNEVIPLYEEAVISTQSADIDAISGATVTWGAYTASIRSAIDKAGL
jgi:uncharacterized protein with FMN-binding domain